MDLGQPHVAPASEPNARLLLRDAEPAPMAGGTDSRGSRRPPMGPVAPDSAVASRDPGATVPLLAADPRRPSEHAGEDRHADPTPPPGRPAGPLLARPARGGPPTGDHAVGQKGPPRGRPRAGLLRCRRPAGRHRPIEG